MKATSFDLEMVQQIRGLVSEMLAKPQETAIVEAVGPDGATVRLTVTGTRIRNVPVVGGAAGLKAGDQLYLQRFGAGEVVGLNPGAIVGGAQPAAPHTHTETFHTREEVLKLLSGKADSSHAHEPTHIRALAGSIGGFEIGPDYLRDQLDSFGLSATITDQNDVRFWVGRAFAQRGEAPFVALEDGTVRNGRYVAGQYGWNIGPDGSAEFANVAVRGEIHAAAIVADEEHGLGATLIVRDTAILYEGVTSY